MAASRLAAAALLGAGLLAACSPRGDDQAAGGADDQRQLNQAAAMLDANGLDAATPGNHESSPHD